MNTYDHVKDAKKKYRCNRIPQKQVILNTQIVFVYIACWTDNRQVILSLTNRLSKNVDFLTLINHLAITTLITREINGKLASVTTCNVEFGIGQRLL